MMAGPGDRPIVFLDVDGTLIPFRARSTEPGPGAARIDIRKTGQRAGGRGAAGALSYTG